MSKSFALPREEDIDLAALLTAKPPVSRGTPGSAVGMASQQSAVRRMSPQSLRQKAAAAGISSSPMSPRTPSSPSVSSQNEFVPRPANVANTTSVLGNKEPVAPTAELFICRESFLVASDFVRSLVDTLNKIERAVDKDGVFDTKVLIH